MIPAPLALPIDDAILARLFDSDLAGSDLVDHRRHALWLIEQKIAALPQVAVPPRHYFTDGLYAREITLPAGCALAGGTHKKAHISVLVAGEVSILTEHGRERLRGPRIFVSPPGVKRIGVAHTDVTWVTFHANPGDCHDADLLWAALIEEPADERGFHPSDDRGGF